VVNLVVDEQYNTWMFIPTLVPPSNDPHKKQGLDKDATRNLPEERKSQNESLRPSILNGTMPVATNTRTSWESKRMDRTKHDENLIKNPQETPPRRGSLKPSSVAPSNVAAAKISPESKPINWLVDDGMLCHTIPDARIFQFG